MKVMIFIFAAMGLFTPNEHAQKMKGFTRSERSFVKNVINIQGELPTNIIKRDDSHIVVEFEDTRVVLKPDGYVGEMWIKTDGNWLSIGTEEEAY
jgi:hypothetical protein